VRDVITGMAGCSGYLAGLLTRDGAWLRASLDDPESALEAELKQVAALAIDDLSSGLRQARVVFGRWKKSPPRCLVLLMPPWMSV